MMTRPVRTSGVCSDRRPLRPLALVLLVVAAIVVSACGGAESPPRTPDDGGAVSAEAAAGKELAGQFCSACHGQDFEGVGGLGPSFHDDAFIQDHTEAELVAFIKEGRPNDAPDNKSGVAMPPYGGNPRLTDEQLGEIVAFLKSLQ
jgi:mono/diheme cytochrome c family protein